MQNHVVTDPAVDIIRDWLADRPHGWVVPADGYELDRLWRDIMEPVVTGHDPQRIALFYLPEQRAFGAHLRTAGWQQRQVGRTRLRRWFPPAT